MPALASTPRFPPTPLWVRALVAIVAIGVPAWWGLQWHERHANEQRLAAIASRIAGRPVHVHCPGVLRSAFTSDAHDGSVQFDLQGHPADVTNLSPVACAELDAIGRGRRAEVIACVAASAADCPGEPALAQALDVVTHESFHLSGIADEAATECRSLQTLEWTAEQMHIPRVAAERLALYQATHEYPVMPPQYRGPCDLPGQAQPVAGR